MTDGLYNIKEPVGDIHEEIIDLAIIPGIAFDKNNNRLGRGKGYYDKLLNKLNVYKIGIGYKCQIVDDIQTDKWDIKMEEVIY